MAHHRCSVFELIFPASFYSSILICGFGLSKNKTKTYKLRANKSQALLFRQYFCYSPVIIVLGYLVSHNKIGDDKDIYNMIMYTKVCETTYLSRANLCIFLKPFILFGKR